MAVFKRFNGKRLKSAKDANWNKGTWYVRKKIRGQEIYEAIPEAQTKADAEAVENRLVAEALDARYGLHRTAQFTPFVERTYEPYVAQHNINLHAKRLYCRLLKEYFKDSPLNQITPQKCRNFRETLRATMSDSSANRVMSTLSRIFTLAIDERLATENPMARVKALSEPPPRKTVLTEEQRTALWTELENDQLMKYLFTLAVHLPLRKGQLLAIRPEHIDFDSGMVGVIGSKGRPPRLVPMNANAAYTLNEMIRQGCLPFPLSDIRKRFDKIMIAAGINRRRLNGENMRGKNFTFHDLRKEFANSLLRKNVNPKLIQRLFAHSDMRITDVYISPEDQELMQAVQQIENPLAGGNKGATIEITETLQ